MSSPPRSPGPSSVSSASTSLSSSASPRRSKTALPITSIPDMRFEQSYLASIRGFVHEVNEQTAEETKEDRLDDHGGHKSGEKAHRVMASRSPTGEPELWMGHLRVQWWPLLYLTVRDQMLSPILQGAVFGIGGLALGHVRTFLQARRQARADAR